MKIKRYVDRDMRHVLRRVRLDQGPEAVILSNRRVDDGIEVIAAVDYDESLIQRAIGEQSGRTETAESERALPQRIAHGVATTDSGEPTATVLAPNGAADSRARFAT